MFANNLGIRLILLVGSAIPRPAPAEVMSAITRIQVTNSDDSGDGFQMTLTLGKGKIPDYTLLNGGSLNLFNRVIIGVLVGLMPEVLIDGVITNHQIASSNAPGMSTLTVTGKDISQMMDLEEANERYPNQSDSVIVGRLLSNYARYGLIPAVTPTTEIPIETDRVTRQYETDLRCIRRLAERNGFVFYVEPVTIGSNKAYWGPKTRAGVLQPALSMNMGGATNLRSLSFNEEALNTASVKASFIESFSKTVIPLPAVPPLRVPPLASTPTPSRRVTLLRDTANQGSAATLREMMSAVTSQPDTVTGDGEVATIHYGHVLRARRLVGIRGAGISHDGHYYVKSVTHRIARGEYSQSFSISREGTGPLTPMVSL
jgi:hypothetical protein